MCENNHISGNHDSVIIQSKTDHFSASVDVSVEKKKIHVSSVSDDVKWKIWDQLYASRRLEIETQWQRTVFLSAFTVLLLTGGGIFYYYFVLKDTNYCNFGYCLTSLLLGGLLMISGILWLAMTKGSKYWTEVYEKKIDLLEKILQIDRQFRYKMEYDAEKDKYSPNRGTDNLLVKTSCIFPLKPDHTSPSSVNCLIGVIILLIGVFMIFLPVFIGHFRQESTLYTMYCNHIAFTSIIVFLVLVILCIFVYHILKHKCKSAEE